jgi:hypothetical protein
MDRKNLWRSAAAVLIGNAIYLGLESFLPFRARHQPFHIDWGLAVDFWICVVCWGVLRAVWK